VALGLAPFGLVDAFRTRLGYDQAGSDDEKSWFAGNGKGRRIDHAALEVGLDPGP
jgi:hypothetical protein